jgi:imidazolonepropionase-like amidohydrolase
MATVFTNVRLFDGEKVYSSANVVVKSGKISTVGIAIPTEGEEGDTVIDGNGHTLLPGLIEAHMHAHLPPGKGTVYDTMSGGRTTICKTTSDMCNRLRNPKAGYRLRHHHMPGHAQHP